MSDDRECIVKVTVSFSDWFDSLTEAEQDHVTVLVKLLERKGINLPHPYSSQIKSSAYGNMRELRTKSGRAAIRVFYAFDPKREAVLLVGGIKRGNEDRFYKVHVAKADAEYKAHLATLKKI